jgi:hypothetical protein
MPPELLIVAGWVLVVPTPTPQVLSKGLPSSIWTVSDCLMRDLPRPEFIRMAAHANRIDQDRWRP